jgi:hypothetical protein
MKIIKPLGWRRLIVLLAALVCAGSWAAGHVRSVQDRSEVAKMTDKKKTVCVGRYLVDVPAAAQVSLHEDVLIALWDNIASSIRLRQPAPPSAPPG